MTKPMTITEILNMAIGEDLPIGDHINDVQREINMARNLEKKEMRAKMRGVELWLKNKFNTELRYWKKHTSGNYGEGAREALVVLLESLTKKK